MRIKDDRGISWRALLIVGFQLYAISQPWASADGNIGCLFADSLCLEDEWCFNDFALGECVSKYDLNTAEMIQEPLTEEQSHFLATMLEEMQGAGLNWEHTFVQCRMQAALFSIRTNKQTPVSYCAEYAPDPKMMNPQSPLAVVRFTPPGDDYADEVYYPPMKKGFDDRLYMNPPKPVHAPKKLNTKNREVLREFNEPDQQDLNEQTHHPEVSQFAVPSEELENRMKDIKNRIELRRMLAEYEMGNLKPPVYFKDGGLEENIEDEGPYWGSNDKRSDVGADEKNLRSILDGSDVVEEPHTSFREISNNYHIPKINAVNHGNMEQGISPGDRQLLDIIGNDNELPNELPHRESKQTFDSNEVGPEGGLYTEGGLVYVRESPQQIADRKAEAMLENMLGFTRHERLDVKKPGPPAGPPPSAHDDTLKATTSAMKPENKEVLPAHFKTEKVNPVKKLADDVDAHHTESMEYVHVIVEQPMESSRDGKRFIYAISELLDLTSYLSHPLVDLHDIFFRVQDNPDNKTPVDVVRVLNDNRTRDHIARRTGIVIVGAEIRVDKARNFRKGVQDQAVVANAKLLETNQPSSLPKIKKVLSHSADEDHAPHSVDTEYAHVILKNPIDDWNDGKRIVNALADMLGMQTYFTHPRVDRHEVSFRVEENPEKKTATDVARAINDSRFKNNISRRLGVLVLRAGIGDKTKEPIPDGVSLAKLESSEDPPDVAHVMAYMFAGAGAAAVVVIVVTLFLIRRHDKNRDKLGGLQSGLSASESCSKDYQELCRARMAGKGNSNEGAASGRIASLSKENDRPPSSRSSTSSWSEEPALTNMDISTGHMVLSYMEDHLKNKGRLQREWEALCRYEAEPSARDAALQPQCATLNRTGAPLPFDHSRVVLNHLANAEGLDYINASTITDHDPRAPAYVAAEGPLPTTLAHFWQMIWEQGAVVIVALCRLQENGEIACARYWPEDGAEVYHIYEVHLVSEHVWCDDYLVRSFYLKNLRTGETRTVTQFHFLSWPLSGVPASAKALLEFRRKVNKSYRGRSCPIVVHSSNGAGRTGAYILLDLVLARMNKGAREIDIAATLEHLRDQRAGLVATRQQFEFVLMAVAEEVHAILKALPANTSQSEKRDIDKDSIKEQDDETDKLIEKTDEQKEK